MGLGSNNGDLITGHVHTLCKQLFLLQKKGTPRSECEYRENNI